MVDLDTLSIVLTGIGLIVAIIYYSINIRNASKVRQRDILFQRLQGYNLEYTKTYIEVASYTDWKTTEEFKEKYGMITNPDAFSKYLYITRVYNLAGLMLKENVADADLLFQLYPPGAIISMWEQFLPFILEGREIRNNPVLDENFEYLYTEAKKMFPEILHRSTFWNT